MARKRRVPTTPKPPVPRRDEPGRLKREPVPPRLRRSKPASPGKQPVPVAQAVPEVNELTRELPIRIGHGWDLHRLEPVAPAGTGRPMIIGGVRPVDKAFTKGPVARSDGDVLLHAVTDAILGALGEPDIGQLFPDTDPKQDGQDSSLYLAEAVRRATEAGYQIGNLDCTVICEKPKIGPIKEQIRLNLARLLGVGPDRVNLKGKTHERVDAVGQGQAIEAHAVVILLLRK